MPPIDSSHSIIGVGNEAVDYLVICTRLSYEKKKKTRIESLIISFFRFDELETCLPMCQLDESPRPVSNSV